MDNRYRPQGPQIVGVMLSGNADHRRPLMHGELDGKGAHASRCRADDDDVAAVQPNWRSAPLADCAATPSDDAVSKLSDSGLRMTSSIETTR